MRLSTDKLKRAQEALKWRAEKTRQIAEGLSPTTAALLLEDAESDALLAAQIGKFLRDVATMHRFHLQAAQEIDAIQDANDSRREP